MIHIFRRTWRPIRRLDANFSDTTPYYTVQYQHGHGAWGLLFNKHAWWLGLHYSSGCKRVCISLLPCLTLWFTLHGELSRDIRRLGH